MLIQPNADPMGAAITDYYKTGRNSSIIVSSNITDDDKIPVKYLYRTYNQMPLIEQTALNQCSGKILDVGAAAGTHSLHLQNTGANITAIDISQLSVQTMLERGVKNAFAIDFFEMKNQKFDTILMLMNGIGICGTLNNLPAFFKQCKLLLNKNGQVIIDSSDLIYLYTNPDGTVDIDLNNNYYGQLTYQMRYKKITGNNFNWLFIDYNLLCSYALKNGFTCTKIIDGKHYDYLAKLTPVN